MKNMVEVRNLKKYFKTPRGMLHAVDDVSFVIPENKTLGVVGESGCGKSTLGRAILKLHMPTAGTVIVDSQDIGTLDKKKLRDMRKVMQIIFQDPYASLNPRKTIAQTIEEPLIIHNIYKNRDERTKKVKELMNLVGLSQRLYDAYPHELDGGRRQRAVIARALSVNPKFIVCDEPVSALDVSIQAQILNLLQDLQEELGITYIFITHDLSVVRHISDEIIVMYLGKIVEKAESDALFKNPSHPYTKALLSAIPLAKTDVKSDMIILEGEVKSPINPPAICRFANRCIYKTDICTKEDPELIDCGDNHFIACHNYNNLKVTK